MRRLLVAIVVLASVFVPAVAGDAQEEETGIILIMDASGSMNQEVGGGITLLDEAKAALREIVLRIPSGTRVGLRVYGHRASNDDPVAGCVDTELVIPVAPLDRPAMLAAIGEFEASGFTPIGLSLQEAADDLGAAGGTVVLVSDGVDTCAPPDPCEVAAQLAADGITSHIHTVGLLLQDPAAVDQLQCIAAAGNGTFTDVASVDGILDALAGVLDEAVEGGIQAAGIQGALQRQLAPVLPWVTGPGIYGALASAEGIIGAGEVRWYAVDLTEADRHLAVDALFDWLPAPRADDVVSVVILDEAGTEVGVPHEVAGLIVTAPQTMPLVEAADWLGDEVDVSFPAVLAVTDPVSMFPAWEPDEEFMQPTIDRFHAAGLNGGVYETFKRLAPADPLPPGRYYIGVIWEGDHGPTRGMQVAVTSYPVGLQEDDWRAGRPHPAVRVDDGSESPFPLDPVRWSGDGIGVGLPEPTRAIEVWSAYDGEPERYVLEMSEGEVLAVGWDVWYGIIVQQNSWVDLGLQGPAGEVEMLASDDEDARLGFFGTGFFIAPSSGEYVITAEVGNANLEAEPAISLAAMVLPADAVDVLEALGMSGGDPGAVAADDLRERARQAVIAGLREVAAGRGA